MDAHSGTGAGLELDCEIALVLLFGQLDRQTINWEQSCLPVL